MAKEHYDHRIVAFDSFSHFVPRGRRRVCAAKPAALLCERLWAREQGRAAGLSRFAQLRGSACPQRVCIKTDSSEHSFVSDRIFCGESVSGTLSGIFRVFRACRQKPFQSAEQKKYYFFPFRYSRECGVRDSIVALEERGCNSSPQRNRRNDFSKKQDDRHCD